MADYRVEWFRERVLSLLGEHDEELFSELLSRDDGSVKTKLVAFITSHVSEVSDAEKRVVFFYKTLHERIVEHEIVVAKKASVARFVLPKELSTVDDEECSPVEDYSEDSKSPPIPPAPPPSAVKSKKGGGGKKGKSGSQRGSNASDSKMSKRSSISGGKGGKKGRRSPTTVVETVTDAEELSVKDDAADDVPVQKEEPRPEVTYVTRVDQEVVLLPVLHCSFGWLSREEQNMQDTPILMFLRQQGPGVPDMETWEQTCSEMPAAFVVGSYLGPVLPALCLLLEKVLTPLYTGEMETSPTRFSSLATVTGSSRSSSLVTAKPRILREEQLTIPDLLHEIKPLAEGLLEYEQSQTPFTLTKKAKNILGKIEEGETDAASVLQDLEPVCSAWIAQIQTKLNDLEKRTPSSEGPIAEIAYWEDQESTLSGLHWQLKCSDMKRMRTVLKGAESPVELELSTLVHKVELMLVDSRAITRSLAPSACHFKELSENTSLVGMRHVLARLMDGLRLVWVLCTPFAKDERMEPLLERVAWLLCHKVALRLDMDTLFKQGAEKALLKAKQGSKLLRAWKDLYFQARQNIEVSGHTPRWEFDCKKLFGQSEYIREVCVDLTEVCKALIHFRAVLTAPELKAALSTPSEVDGLLKKVSALIAPIQQDADFEVFLACNSDSWRSFINHFRRNVHILEQEVCEFFQETFTLGNISSSRDTLNLLTIYASTETRDNIRMLLMSKYELVMNQFLEEIEKVRSKFMSFRASPPLLRNQPEAAGAIFWCRSLFMYLKKSVLLFQNVSELQNCPLTKEAFSAYVQLTRQMKCYQDEHFEEWTRKTEDIIASTINTNVVKIIKKPSRRSVSAAERRLGTLYAPPESRADRSSSESSRLTLRPVLASLRWVARAIAAKKRASMGSDSSFVLPHIELEPTSASVASLGLQYQVEFNDRLLHVLIEAEQMEHLSLELTPLIKRHAVRRTKLDQHVRHLKHVIEKLNTIVAPLDEAQIALLQLALKEAERAVEPGVSRLKWVSKSLTEYCSSCEKAVNTLSSYIQKEQMCSQHATEHINQMKNYNLFFISSEQKSDVLPWKEFFKQVELNRLASIACLLKSYRAFSAIFIELEKNIDSTSTGRKLCMAKYYFHWEQQIYEALLGMVIKNLQYFANLLTGEKVCLQLDATLVGTDLCLSPSAPKAYDLLISNVSSMMLALKVFPRWMTGTCLPCPDPDAKDSPAKATKMFTFLDELVKVQQVKDGIHVIDEAAQNILLKTKAALHRWKKYKLLWQYNKGNTCILFADKKPSIVAYDEKLLYFSNIIQKLERSANHVDIGCVRLNLQPLLLEIRRHALSWKQHLAHDVLAASKLKRRTFLMKTFMLKFEMEKPVKEDDMASLKNVLDAIVRIRQTSAEAEVQAQQIEESYRTLTLYDIEVDESDLKLSEELLPCWDYVRLSSLVRMEELQPLKERYAMKTETFVKAFATRCEDFVARFFSSGPGSELANLTQGLASMKSFTEELEILNIERQRLVEEELLFDVPLADFSALHNVENTMKHLDSVFYIYEAQKAARDVWASTLWIDLSPSTLKNGMRHFIEMFDDLPLEAQTMPVAVQLRQNMKDFQNSVPMFEALKNDALRERHWQQLMQKTGKHFDVSPENFTLQSLFAMELHQHKEESASIVLHATRELVIEKLIADIKRAWGGKEFTLIPHVRRGENFGFVLGPVNEICQLQLDHSNSLKQVFTSPYVGPFIESVTEWEKNLSHVQETLALWMRVQDEWLDMGHVFENEEIFSQLSHTVIPKFEYCDKNFRMIMSETSKNSLVVAACCRSGCLEELKNISHALEECQSCLRTFLSAKRQIFPRLNFVTDQELLSLIGGKLPQCVQQQITKLKLFPHIASLEFEDGDNGQMSVTALVSQEGERVELRCPVDTAHCEVENWLGLLVPRLQAALRYKIKFAIYDYGHTKLSQEQWAIQFAGMVSLAALHVWWTVKVEDVFEQLKSGDIRSMKIYLDELNQQIDYLSKYLISVKDNMEKVKLTSILIQKLHFRDIVSHLVFNAVIVKTDFNWESQLRFYWEKREDSLIVKQCCCRLEFGYEYTGLNYRLVHTPQTDRVMLIITQALSMQLGVMLIGGPGLGKTETVREMARILGRICLVTDCNAQMTWKSIGNILAGLAQSGLWVCLEQLDRLSESTLSVLSTQIQTIRDAVLMKLTSFSFNDQEIGLDSKLAIFTTISPSQKGRQPVPQTLRALFRPASCSMPDLQHICHVWLLATGFDTAQILSKKVTELCKYSAEQLSKQPHYNFKMCLVKTIIKYSAKYRMLFPESSENNVVLKALRDCILPKLVPEDIELFLALLKDMFPRVEIPEVSRSTLRKAIEECIISDGYTSIPGQVDTIMQLDDLLSVNSTAILIGSSGSGKSVIVQLLAKAKSQLGFATEIAVLSPKSCPIVDFFGIIDPETEVWKDGLFTYIYKTVNRREKYQRIKTFILFDGTVDPNWIENICSVLDENRLLTLPNGDKIPLKKQCNILFEVGTLQFFSPALLSRVCPIFVNTNENMHDYVWNRWLKTHPDITVELQKLYQMFVPSMIKNIGSHKMKTILHFSTLNMITQLCYMIDVLLTNCVDFEKDLTCCFIQALYLSMGATILVQHRENFDTHVKDILGWKMIEDSPQNVAIYQEIPIGSLFEYFWDTSRQAWINWSWNVAAYIHEPEKPLSEILVPTSYTGQTTWLLNLITKFYFHELFFQKVFRPLVLVGTTGSSKTITIQSFLRNLDLTIYLPQSVALSSSTSAMQIQSVIEATMQNRTRDVLEPIAGKKVVIFLDDLNMPMVDEFGSREPIEFLRLLYEQGGMYGRGKEMTWKQLKDIGFVGAISILSGPAAPLDPRFLSKLCLVHLPRPPEHLLHQIFSQILRGHLKEFAGAVLELTDSIVSASLHLFQLLYEALPPTPARWTCHLSTRDLTRLFGGICLSNPSHFCTAESIVRLWRHEVCRVFTDRFESQDDQDKVKHLLESTIHEYFKPYSDHVLRNPILFGDFRNALANKERSYEDLLDFEAVYFLFQEVLEELNRRKEGPRLELVLFDDALEHLVRLHRVLRLYRGHAVLIGGPGMGRKSLTRLTMLAAHCTPVYLPRTSSEQNALRQAVQKIFVQMGVYKTTMALLITDADLEREGVPEMLHHIILNGWIPGLFSSEDKDTVIDKLEKIIGPSSDREAVWLTFQRECSSRLHIVLSISKQTLKKHSEIYPCFTASTALDWYKPWPLNALMKVAKHFISNNQIPKEHRNTLQSHSVWVHFSACAFYKKINHNMMIPSSPRLYLDYLHCFLQILEENTKRIKIESDLLTLGLARISHARDLLSALGEQLLKRESMVAQHESACELLVEKIQQVRDSTEKKRELAMEWNRTIERQEKMLSSEKIQAQQILETAQPDLDQARSSVQNLQENDFQYIRSLETPPEALRLVCSCILLLLRGQRDVPWEIMQETVSNLQQMQELSQLRCEELAYKHIRMIKVQLKKAKDLEDFEIVDSLMIGTILLQFIEAILKYCNTLREVKPRLEVIIHLESELSQARDAMSTLLEEVTCEDQALKNLQEQHTLITQEMQELRNEAAIMRDRLLAADKLFTSLGSEEEKWEHKLADVSAALNKLPGDCLIVAALLNYAGLLRGLHPRQDALEEWCHPLVAEGVPLSQPFQPELQLLSWQEKNSWNTDLSQEDRVMLENLLIMTHSTRFPLCIDPQQQATQWLKSTNPNLLVTSTNDPEMIAKIEKAIIGGQTILLQDIGRSIDSSLHKLLDKIIILEGKNTFIEFGDKKVSYNPKFKIFLNTREGSPQLEPFVYTKTTVIDCTITAQALESCLLNDIVAVEQPTLLRQSEATVKGLQTAETRMHELERSLLRRLAESSQEKLLEDPQLLLFLEETKGQIRQLSREIERQREQQVVTTEACKRYRLVAERAALLFSVLVDMAHVAPPYQFSLTMFRKIMRASVQQTPATEDLEQRLTTVADSITRSTYSFVCRALFAQHQTCFILTLLLRLQVSQGEIAQVEVSFFSRMSDIEIDPLPEELKLPSWITLETFENCRKLSKTMPILFGNLTRNVQDPVWEDWIKSESPEVMELPLEYHKLLSPFQKILLLRCMRNDRVIPAVQRYILQCLGEYYITPIIPSMRVLLAESSPQVPVLLLLSQGADPSMELLRLARQSGRDSGQFVTLALGKGLEQAALAALQNAIRRGQWLLLLNCHLAPTVPALVWRLLENSKPHTDFRLWLTSDPTPHLPASLLHSALKVVLEIPKGLKLKLNNTFRKLELDNTNKNIHPQFMASLYVLTHLHATLQERVEYAGSGWNANYTFTKSDFEACITFLKNYLSMNDNKTVPWDGLRALIGKTVYCSHMNDKYDMRVVNTYLQEFCGGFAFLDQFCFYRDQNITYSLPSMLNTFGILAHIQSLPLGNSCVILGLNTNAETRHNEAALLQLISQISQLQTQPVVINEITTSETHNLELLDSIRSKLPPELDKGELLRRTGSTGPSLSFILRELDAFNYLLQAIKQTLTNLEQALQGMTRINADLEQLLLCLRAGNVPVPWRALCPPTNKTLTNWMEHLKQRHDQYYDWIMKHVPLVVWMSGLHSPRSFLLSVLQSASRKHHWSLEQAGLRLTVASRQNLPAIQDGTYIRGLYLENASWDFTKDCLQPAAARELIVPFPVIAVVAVEKKPEQLSCSLSTPVYATRRCGNASLGAPLWEIDLPCSEHPSNWVLRGVRLLLDPD